MSNKLRLTAGFLILAVFCSLGMAADGQPQAPPEGSAAKAPPSAPPEAAAGPDTDPAAQAKPPANPSDKPPTGQSPGTYVIGAEDVLNILVWHEAELSKQVIVQPDGKITLPLVNDVIASGLTPEQLAATIKKELMKVMVAPEVSVAVQQVNSKKYYIQGEVSHPGAFPLAVPTTVMEGLANAGGFRDFANLKNIKILRNHGAETLKFNYKEVSQGKHLEQNVLLQPGDQIIVK